MYGQPNVTNRALLAELESPLLKSEKKERSGNPVRESQSCNRPRWSGNNDKLSVACQVDEGDQVQE